MPPASDPVIERAISEQIEGERSILKRNDPVPRHRAVIVEQLEGDEVEFAIHRRNHGFAGSLIVGNPAAKVQARLALTIIIKKKCALSAEMSIGP